MLNNTKFCQNLARFRLVTFDITDTLIRFKTDPAIQYYKTAKQLGVTVDQRAVEQSLKKEFKHMHKLHPNWGYHTPNFTWQDWWSQLVKKTFLGIKPDIEPEKLQEVTDTLISIYRTSECYCHLEGGQELVDKVRNSVQKVGVISNFDPSLRQVLDEVNLADKFDFILTSYDVGFQKPHREIYDAALEMCDMQPHKALHIGNMHEFDYMGARNAGWSGLLVTSAEKDLKKTEPTQGYHSIRELLNALDNEYIKW